MNNLKQQVCFLFELEVDLRLEKSTRLQEMVHAEATIPLEDCPSASAGHRLMLYTVCLTFTCVIAGVILSLEEWN